MTTESSGGPRSHESAGGTIDHRSVSQREQSTTESPATVLVVDDERDLAELYTSWLRDDYAVRTATSGDEALERLTDNVDVVLLDRRLPDRSGESVLAEIRARGLDCRVAMVTAIEPATDVVEMGFDDYLTKPVSQNEVRRTVDWLLEIGQHDALIREYFALASKLAALEASRAAADLRRSDEYERVVARIEAVEHRASDRLSELFAREGGERAFRRFVSQGAQTEGDESAATFGLGGD